MDEERRPSDGVPFKLFEGLARLAALAAEPLAAPVRRAWCHLVAFNFGADRCLTASIVFGRRFACVCGWGSGRKERGDWCTCCLLESQVLLSMSARVRVSTNNSAAWAVRLAVRLRRASAPMCGDNEVALGQVLSLRACSHLRHQQAILRSLSRILRVASLLVRLVWMPLVLQLG